MRDIERECRKIVDFQLWSGAPSFLRQNQEDLPIAGFSS
jgi:hypothetical protein